MPRGVWTDKEERMYEHVKESTGSKRIAAATVNKRRRRALNPDVYGRVHGILKIVNTWVRRNDRLYEKRGGDFWRGRSIGAREAASLVYQTMQHQAEDPELDETISLTLGVTYLEMRKRPSAEEFASGYARAFELIDDEVHDYVFGGGRIFDNED